MVDLSLTLAQIQRVLGQVTQAVELLFGFTLLAGLVVLTSSVTATREARAREYAVMRAVGAGAGLLRHMQSAELLGVGLLAGLLCLDPRESLSPGQAEEIERVSRTYPFLTDDAFVAERLKALGLTVVPSQANFLYFDVNQDGKAVFEALLRRGVIVRHLSGPFLRVTIGLPRENERFLTALQTVLSK